jgi:hypothetical protein
MSAGAIEAMANELHAVTFKLCAAGDMLKAGLLRESELDAIGDQIALIAHRAQHVAQLERKLGEGGAL